MIEVWDGLTGELVARFTSIDDAETYAAGDENFSVHRPPRVVERGAVTQRELEVLGLVAEGLRNRAIADRLGLSVQTVKNHVSTAIHRLGAKTRRDAVAIARRRKLL